MLNIYSILLLIIGIYTMATTLLNLLYFKKLAKVEPFKGEEPLVSVIIPARDEERALPRLLESMTKQSYKNLEVLVINDQSSDRTQEIIEEFEKKDSRIRGFKTDPSTRLSKHGKMNALLQLIPHAKGKYLLATDADTVHASHSIAHTVGMMEKHGLDIMSGLPTQLNKSYRAGMNTSSMMFANTMIPHFLLYKLQIPSLAFAIGQYIIMRRDSYYEVGGYESVTNKIVDDIGIIRLFVKNKKKYAFVNLSEDVACYMYATFKESFRGIERSIIGVFPAKYWVILPLAIAVVLLLSISWSPIAYFVFLLLGIKSEYMSFLLIGWVLFCFSWYLGCRNINFRKLISISCPLSVTCICMMYINGLYRRLSGKNFVWKGRIV